jgi:hypothetical protein
VLDGTSPVAQPQMANSFIEANEQYVRIFEQCAADPACNEAYPNLAERFTALLNQLQENPIVLEDPIEITGVPARALHGEFTLEQLDTSFFSILIIYNSQVSYHLYGEAYSLVEQIPRIILALEEGDVEYVREAFATIPEPQGPVATDTFQNVPDDSEILPDNDYIAPTIETLLAEAQNVPAVASAATPEQQWVALSINHLVTRLQEGETQTDVIRDMLEVTILPAKGRDPQLLIDYANEYLPEELAAQANTLVEAMTPADVRATMWHLNEVAEAMRFNPEQQAGYHEEVTFAVNCAEDVALQSADVMDEVITAATYPHLIVKPKEEYEYIETACSFFPDSNIDPSFAEPVVSDTPVLLLQGDLDTNTPPSQARDVESHLTNATYVPFNTEGHVVTAQTAPCPGTIAAQFLANPAGTLDTSCTEEFVIDFELP